MTTIPESSKISVRDAVRREALKYFSSNPGSDSVGPNTSLHSRASKCLSEQEMSLEQLASLSSALLYRNTVTELAQKHLDVMDVDPVCDFCEFDHQYLGDKKLNALADQTDSQSMMCKANPFMVDAAIGLPYDEPQVFVLQSLLAAGFLPGKGFEEKLEVAKQNLEKESALLRSVKDLTLKLRDSNETEQGYLDLLRQTCDMDREFEYEKRVICGKHDILIYRNDSNACAYNMLDAMGFEPMWLFEKFGTFEWALLVTTGGRSRQADADKLLSLVKEILPYESALHRKINKYIVIHAMKLDVEAFREKVAKVREARDGRGCEARSLGNSK